MLFRRQKKPLHAPVPLQGAYQKRLQHIELFMNLLNIKSLYQGWHNNNNCYKYWIISTISFHLTFDIDSCLLVIFVGFCESYTHTHTHTHTHLDLLLLFEWEYRFLLREPERRRDRDRRRLPRLRDLSRWRRRSRTSWMRSVESWRRRSREGDVLKRVFMINKSGRRGNAENTKGVT